MITREDLEKALGKYQVENKELQQENEQLKQKLAEKEKEIEELKEKLYWTENGIKLALLMERHKVCDEIRTAVDLGNVFNDGTIKISENDFDDILKRIEGVKNG